MPRSELYPPDLNAIASNLVKLAAVNKPDEFVPLGMRQSNGVSDKLL